MEVNQEKNYLSGVLDKKCTFGLVISVQALSMLVIIRR